MGKRNLIETFSVVGNVSFPIDMLRYDGCYPASEIDAGRIEESCKFCEHGREIELRTVHASAPTEARWRSFGWRVVKINGAPILGVPHA